MKITIAVAELARVLKQASGVVQSKVTIEVLKYIKIEIHGASATAYASDLGMSLIQTFPIMGLTDAPSGVASVLLPAAKVASILAGLTARETVVFDITDKGILMTSGKFKAKMPTLPADQFPDIEKRPETKFTVKSGILKHLIRRVEAAVPSKEGKFSIPVIHFEGTAELLRAVATDGFRIAVSDAPPVGVFSIDLPKTALPVLKEFRGEDIQFSETETKYFFSTDKEILLVQKSVAKFPPYQRALNAAFTVAATAPSNDFGGTLALLDPLTDTSDPRTLVQLGSGALTLSTSSIEGDGEEVLDVITEGAAFHATLNPKYIQDFLSQAEGQAIKIQGSTEKAPVLFSREDTHGPYRYFLMPIQPKSAEKKA